VSPTLRERWRQLGRLPALGVVAATYAVLLPVVLAVDNPARRIAGCVLIAVLVSHCLARTAGGWRVFIIAGVTALLGTVLDDIIALPRWTGLLFGPFALVLAWFEDHPDEDESSDQRAREALR